jgi:hypothetical protein
MNWKGFKKKTLWANDDPILAFSRRDRETP